MKSPTTTEQTRQRLKIYLPILQAVVFAGVVMALGVKAYNHLADAETLPIREVKVEGEFRHLAPASLEKRVVGVVTGGFFNVNVSTIQRVLKKEPWVSRVSVRRVWPDTLKVEVHERDAIARWGEKGLMDSTAEVFYPSPESIPTDLISLNAPQGAEQLVLQRFDALLTQLEGLGLKLKQLDLSERRAWSFVLEQGTTVILGRNEFEQRLDRFVAVYDGLLKAQFEQIKFVDLRYSNGLAVRWDKTKTLTGNG